MQSMQIVSDLHLELKKPKHIKLICQTILRYSPKNVTMLALLGDIGNIHSIKELMRVFVERYDHILFVPGNHEFYNKKRTMSQIRESLKKLEDISPKKIHVLDNDIVTINNQRFLGTTLWSHITFEDFMGMNDRYNITEERELTSYNNYKVCKFITQEDYLKLNKDATEWLQDNMLYDDIILTHHLPSRQCVDTSKYTFNTGYFSDLDSLIKEKRPQAWFYGHSHSATSLKIFHLPENNDTSTTLASNPLGYLSERTRYNPSTSYNFDTRCMQHLQHNLFPL